jgi:hypothetical protein
MMMPCSVDSEQGHGLREHTRRRSWRASPPCVSRVSSNDTSSNEVCQATWIKPGLCAFDTTRDAGLGLCAVCVTTVCVQSVSRRFVCSLCRDGLCAVCVTTVCVQSVSRLFVCSLCHEYARPWRTAKLSPPCCLCASTLVDAVCDGTCHHLAHPC